MKSAAITTVLTALCIAETMFIVGLLGGQEAYPISPVESARPMDGKSRVGEAEKSTAANQPSSPAAGADLAERYQTLETKLAEVTKELNIRKSEIAFSYGSVREAGRFVGITFRKMFETAAARESKEAEARRVDNQINVLSLGPFIQDAEIFESDPAAFAQFQAPLISEVLGLPPERSGQVEALLADLKTKSLKLEEGSDEWMQLNDAAMQSITALIPEAQRPAMKAQINFLQQYGVLVIPAYSILRAPTPTIVQP